MRHVNEDEQMSEFAFALQFLEPGTMTHDGRHRRRLLVENAAVEWNERESPFHVVARLRLLPKSVLPPAQAETFSIDVTEHSTPNSRPIGSINCARWHAESASRAARLAQLVGYRGRQTDVGRRFVDRARRRRSRLRCCGGLGDLARHERSSRADQLTYPSTPLGSNGLTGTEREQHYHLSEGGEAYPIAWLLALEQVVRGRTAASRIGPSSKTSSASDSCPIRRAATTPTVSRSA